MQQDLDKEYWEKKGKADKTFAINLNANNNAVGLLDVAERMGLLKHIQSIDDLIVELNGYRNRLRDWGWENINVNTTETQVKHTFSDKDRDMGSATDTQRKATWAIIHGKDGRPELESELPDSIENLSFEEASDFIEKYGRKK